MKKKILAIMLVAPFVFTACSFPGSNAVDNTENGTEVLTELEAETEITYELDSSFVGIWVTGENEDMTAITISSDLSWRTMNVNGIDGFTAVGGDVKPTADAVELLRGDEIYDTVSFGSEPDTLYSANGYTYKLDNSLKENTIENYTGTWQTGENEDLAYLDITLYGTWNLYPADEVEEDNTDGGTWTLTDTSLELYNGDILYNTVYFGTEAETLDSTEGYNYKYICGDYCDYFGTWTTGQNEDTTTIRISGNDSWQTVNTDEIEGFEEIGGSIRTNGNSIELYNGDKLYDTISLGDDYDTLNGSEDKTYTAVEE